MTAMYGTLIFARCYFSVHKIVGQKDRVTPLWMQATAVSVR
jgi:hypothetical protein